MHHQSLITNSQANPYDKSQSSFIANLHCPKVNSNQITLEVTPNWNKKEEKTKTWVDEWI